MVAGENHDEAGAIALDDIDVLIDGITASPRLSVGFGDALAGRKNIETLVAFGPEEVPAHLQVPDEAMGLVLGRDRDPSDAGVQGGRKRDIHNARRAAELDRRFGAQIGQFHQAAAAAAGKDKGEGMTRERFVSVSPHDVSPA